MSEETDIESLDLTDAQLLELIKNHGIDRRTVVKLLGAGSALSLGAGTVAAGSGPPGSGNRRQPHEIDPVYGAPYTAPGAPDGLADHEISLHVRVPEEGPPPPPEFFFDPVGIHVHRGAVVNFQVHHGLHTVTAIHSKYDEPGVFSFPDRIPDSAGPHAFTSPIVNTGDAWLYQFNEPGLYDIMCLPHYTFGMVVRVVVTGPNDSPVPVDNYDETLLPPPAKAVFDHPKMTPSNIINEGPIAWDDI